MKRLIDMPASSPALEQAQRLIEAAPQVDDSTEQMLRIRRALDQPAARGAILRAPAFALGGALVVFGASAFAAVRVWVEHRAPHQTTETTETTDATERRAGTQADASSAPLLAAAPAAPQPPAAEAKVARASAERAVVASAAEPVAQATQRDASRVSPRARVKAAQKASRVRRAKLKQARGSRAAASRVASVAPEATPALPLELPVPAAEPTREQVDSIAAAPLAARVQSEPERVAPLSAAEPNNEAEEREEAGVGVSEPEVSSAAKRSSDSELVVRAVRALRRDRDPEAASRLLERYRSRNPRGVLAEEVLSLQIEAALAAKDSRATSYAREYMSRYPEGRYRARAQSALSGRVP